MKKAWTSEGKGKLEAGIHTEGIDGVQDLVHVQVVEPDESEDLSCNGGIVVLDTSLDGKGVQELSI